MRYNRLGRTDMVVSQCGLGMAHLSFRFDEELLKMTSNLSIYHSVLVNCCIDFFLILRLRCTWWIIRRCD